MHQAQTCLAIGEEPQICHEWRKKPPQMTIKPDQYFMKMKCSGSVYSGGGGSSRRRTNGGEALFTPGFSLSDIFTGGRAGAGPPGPPRGHGSGVDEDSERMARKKSRTGSASFRKIHQLFQKLLYQTFFKVGPLLALPRWRVEGPGTNHTNAAKYQPAVPSL